MEEGTAETGPLPAADGAAEARQGQAGLRGHKRAKRKAARAHAKVAAQRQDTARKWAKSVVRDHDRIAVEDFRPKFLAKSTMARKAADAAIGAENVSSRSTWRG
jgi:hypothetical protein